MYSSPYHLIVFTFLCQNIKFYQYIYILSFKVASLMDKYTVVYFDFVISYLNLVGLGNWLAIGREKIRI